MTVENVPGNEQETICNYDYLTDSWSIYTNVRKHITRLTKVIGEKRFDKISRNSEGRITEVTINGLDHANVRMRAIPAKSEMSEAQKQALMKRKHRTDTEYRTDILQFFQYEQENRNSNQLLVELFIKRLMIKYLRCN